MHVLAVAHDDHADMTTMTARAIFHEWVGASRPPRPSVQQDLVGGVGDGRQGVAGEDRQGQLLRQQGLAEAVAAHRDRPRITRLTTRPRVTDTNRHCMPARSAGRVPGTRPGHCHRSLTADVGVASATSCTSSSWAAAASARPRPGHRARAVTRSPSSTRTSPRSAASAPPSRGAPSPGSASTATPCGPPASTTPTPSPPSRAATTRTSSPPASRARSTASSTSWRASTTRAAPRSTSASASPPSPR